MRCVAIVPELIVSNSPRPTTLTQHITADDRSSSLALILPAGSKCVFQYRSCSSGASIFHGGKPAKEAECHETK